MTTAFVILNYNSADLTIRLAKMVEQYPSIDYIVLVDNCSTDNSYNELKKIENNRIIIHETGKNGGYSFGNNYGAKVCKELGVDIMFISNPDIHIKEKDINLILESFKESEYSLLTGLQYEIDGSLGQPPIQIRYTYNDDLIDCFILGRKFFARNHGKNVDKSIKIQDMNMFRGSFFGILLDDYFEVGGFDEDFFLYCEERVLSKKLENNQKKIGIVTNARYDHMHSVSISKTYRQRYQRMKLLYKSRFLYNQKYNRIGKIRTILLLLAFKISLLEYYLADGALHSQK